MHAGRKKKEFLNLLITSFIRGCGRFVFCDLSFELSFDDASGNLRISLVKRYHPEARSSVLKSINMIRLQPLQ